ncbi:polyprenyl synthetase family protein [Pseudomonas gingeri]|uniref:polyprenyl synthetase family protein n=1 Tax=Pseudomonas gingeri TaxID=117681 RepID=UPI0015A2EC16|nr:farnesyl diphosphate synthase [Pseudomonas gingeri]NWA11280.1 polyprenyl synthetase family protein [Pseudomonas gingeri]
MTLNAHDALATLLPTENALPTFGDWRHAVLGRIERRLEDELPPLRAPASRLHDAMRYAVLNGGKRLRPLLCQASGIALGAKPQTLDRVGAALEMVHVTSLIHDDLPAMDDDNLRRGRATVHVKFDEATAILTGTALLAQAFTTLRYTPLPASRQALLMAELARAIGAQGMCGGQMLDLSHSGLSIDRATLEHMHQLKTGALIQAALRMGALCAPAVPPDLGKLDRYAAAIGLAFQVVDDILDVTQDSATLGKTAGKDARDKKPTYVSLLGLEPSRRLARQLNEQAHAALANFDGRTTYLHDLADVIVNRLR